jgi:hypothetical protein
MLAVSIETQQDHWAMLQNRPHSLPAEEDTFYALLAALDSGWHIESPVYVRPRWGSEHLGKVMYHFILRNGTGTTMVSVADGPRVREYIQAQGLQVNGPQR